MKKEQFSKKELGGNDYEWPKYYNDQLIFNKPAGIAIVCGWTKKEMVWKMIYEKEKVAVLGQLYSKEGINYVIRNIFLNPGIKHIVFVGQDLSGSMKEFIDFLENGKSKYIHKEISDDCLKEFCNYFSSNYGMVELEYLNDYIEKLTITNKDWRGSALSFSEHKIVLADTLPSEETCFRVEDEKIANVWLKVLDRIIKFGKEKMSSYGELQRELLNIVTVINKDSSKDPFLPDYMYCNEQDILSYYPQLMTANLPQGIEYTYGSRLRDHEGVNQIEGMIKELEKERYSRRAIAFTWNVEKDCNNVKCPCLDLIQAVVQIDKLYLTAYFRSNDMYRAWPQNAYGLLAIQEELAQALGLKNGKLTIISCSAHVYERDLGEAKEVVTKHKSLIECNIDSRGSFVIRVEKGEIIVKHIDLNGMELQQINGKSFIEIRDKISPFVSDIAHGIYLGSELTKAERALINNTKYVQDE